MQITTHSIAMQHLGPVGKYLCWAEVAASIVEHYTPGCATPFCKFVGFILGEPCCNGGVRPIEACNKSGKVAAALAKAKITVLETRADLAVIIAELRDGRPLVLRSGSTSGLHAMTIVGALDQNNLQAVEVLDPIDGDFRRLYLWSLYQKWADCGLFRQQITAPQAHQPTRINQVATKWPLEKLLGDLVVKQPLPAPPDALLNALHAFLGPVGAERALADLPFAYFPLEIAELGATPEQDRTVDSGWRCFFRDQETEGSVVIDVFARHGSARVGRITTGLRTAARVSALKRSQVNATAAERLVGFKEWLNLGLDTAIVGGQADAPDPFFKFGPSGKLQLFGPRGYAGLDRDDDGEERPNQARVLDQLRPLLVPTANG